jgi:rhodanese-related sulfurtransferase
MKLILSYLGAMITAVALTASTTAAADPPIPITADEAFDAVQMQVDPATGTAASVVLVDVRDPVEYFFTGAPAQVTKIYLLDEKEVVPDWGKVRLLHEGKFIEYGLDGRYKRTQVDKISRLEAQVLALNIPFWLRTPDGWDKTSEDDFYLAINELAVDYDVLILYCRTGGRSSLAGDGVDPTLFFTVYEIDDPKGKNGSGGFSGPSYSRAYNGYVGFPGRLTDNQDHPSVSWSDSGLPIATTVMPISPTR